MKNKTAVKQGSGIKLLRDIEKLKEKINEKYLKIISKIKLLWKQHNLLGDLLLHLY